MYTPPTITGIVLSGPSKVVKIDETALAVRKIIEEGSFRIEIVLETSKGEAVSVVEKLCLYNFNMFDEDRRNLLNVLPRGFFMQFNSANIKVYFLPNTIQ